MSECYLCLVPTDSGCGDCDARVCHDHAGQHTLSPGQCVPWSVVWREGVGRCLVAARDIVHCEEILVDTPAMVAPYYDPQPMCLECLVRTDGQETCDQCGLPLCHEQQCRAGPQHQQECQFWSNLRSRVDIPPVRNICININMYKYI